VLDRRFSSLTPREDVDVGWRQQKFHGHDKIGVRTGKIVFRRVGQVVAPKLRKNDFSFKEVKLQA
jgi:hypothetical protein